MRTWKVVKVVQTGKVAKAVKTGHAVWPVLIFVKEERQCPQSG